ncbi:hypothetical protein D3C84_939090 [compost metagenome]
MQFGDDVVAVQFRQLRANGHAAEHVSRGRGLIGNEFGVGLTVDLRLHGEYVNEHWLGHFQIEVQQCNQLFHQLIGRQIDRLRFGQVKHQVRPALAVGGFE